MTKYVTSALMALALSLFVSANRADAATTNARFTYQAASNAFATGAAPTLQELLAVEWMLVGSAAHTSVPAGNTGSGLMGS